LNSSTTGKNSLYSFKRLDGPQNQSWRNAENSYALLDWLATMQETNLQKPKAIFMGAVLFTHNYLHTIYPFNLPWCNVDPSWHYSMLVL